uniref:CUB domain-containing protein n=1 Tax=Meloidogyne incognita TaxID=6306 RepID=A0A914LA18_MELIC
MLLFKNIFLNFFLILSFLFLINSQEKETLIKDCGHQINNLGGRISLDGQESLIGQEIECIWLINIDQKSSQNFSFPTSTDFPHFDYISLRVDKFYLKGENLKLEIREGSNSEGNILIEFKGEQTTKQLIQKQSEQGFEISSLNIDNKENKENGFYVRLTGKIENVSGLSIPYSYFYHWPAPPCASVEEFYCDNHKCISRILRCDGYDHCGDSSDEMCKGGEIHIEYDPLWKSAVLTVVFALLALLLLTLLMVLLVSRTARRHLIHSLPSRSTQCINRNQRRRGRREASAVTASIGNNQRVANCCQGTGGRLMPGITHHQNCSHFNNSIINNCQHPTIQTLGDRRFYLFPSDRAPISLIEAPPTYQDALKHPKFTSPPARNSRHLVHPTTDRPEISGFQNLNFRLSPNELQMEFEEIERENERIRWLQMNENGIEEEEEGIERNEEREEEEEDNNKEEELPQTINLVDEFEEINLNDDNEDGKSKKEEKCEEECCYISGPRLVAREFMWYFT